MPLKKLIELNQDESKIPVFQDEVHFQAQTTTTRVWAEKGSAPKVKSKPGRDHASYSGFVIPETGELVVTQPEVFNYETVIQSLRDFLEAKPCPEGKKYCVIYNSKEIPGPDAGNAVFQCKRCGFLPARRVFANWF